MAASRQRYELLNTRITRFTRMLPGVEAGDVRAIHRARVATRRLREILPILQLDTKLVRKLNKRLRRITRALGPVRELDVLHELIAELHESRRREGFALRHVAEFVRQARDKAHRRLSNRESAEAMRRAGRKLEAVAEALNDETGSSRNAWRWAIEARMAHRAAALKAAVADAGAVYLPERLHAVRIAAKKLRYALELHVEAGAEKSARDLAALKRLQRLLGRMHDLQVLIDRVREVQAAEANGHLPATRELDATAIALDRSCRRLHARFVRERDMLLAICDRASAKSTRRGRASITKMAPRARASERRAS
jgi:CHAD domain-containing protein